MRHIEFRRKIQLDQDPLPWKYPLKYATSGKNPDISLIIRDRFNERQIPPGTYHFNHVSCTCRPEKTSLLDRIQSLFKRKSLRKLRGQLFFVTYTL